MATEDLAGWRTGAVGHAPTLEWRQRTRATTVMLIVIIETRNVGGSVVSGVTFNGLALTRQMEANTNGSLHFEIWMYKHPPTEIVGNIVVTMTGTDPALGLSGIWNTGAI